MINGVSLAVATGLTVGAAFIVIFAISFDDIRSLSSPPSMILFTGDSSYEGGIQSYCIYDTCKDVNIAPVTEPIIISKDSNIRLALQSHRQPNEITVSIDLPANNSVYLPPKMDNQTYLLDLEQGDYVMEVQARWLDKDVDLPDQQFVIPSENVTQTTSTIYYYSIRIL